MNPVEKYTLNTEGENIMKTVAADNMYPVGSFMMTTVNTNPSKLISWLADTEWEMLNGNCALQTVSQDVGDTYNSSEAKSSTDFILGTYRTGATTLEEDQMPSHTHDVTWGNVSDTHTHDIQSYVDCYTTDTSRSAHGLKDHIQDLVKTESADAPHSHTYIIGNTGGESHYHFINMPYVKMYMWKRIN